MSLGAFCDPLASIPFLKQACSCPNLVFKVSVWCQRELGRDRSGKNMSFGPRSHGFEASARNLTVHYFWVFLSLT